MVYSDTRCWVRTWALLVFAAGAALAAGYAAAQDGSLLIYNGETEADYWAGTTNHDAAQVFMGTGCFEGSPEQYVDTGINLSRLTSNGASLANFDEIWFFAKSDQAAGAATFSLSFAAWPNTSRAVSVDGHIQGGARLDQTWRLVRIPIADLKTADYGLTTIQQIWFGHTPTAAKYKIYVDEMWAVKTSVFPPSQCAIIGTLPPVDFGSVAVKSTSAPRTVQVTNVGTGDLVVTNVELKGDNAGDFAFTSPTTFTVRPGASSAISLTFQPSVYGARTASLVLTHSATFTGATTSVSLKGTGLSPSLALSADALDFGKIPVGGSASVRLVAANAGNQDLAISSVAFTPSDRFAGLLDNKAPIPNPIVIAQGANGGIIITFTPPTTLPRDQAFNGTLTLQSNDPNQTTAQVQLLATGAAQQGGVGELAVKVGQATSSTVDLSWPLFSGTDHVDVYIGAEPSSEAAPASHTQKLPAPTVRVASLPGTSTGYRIEKLAAATDVFIHVEAVAADQTTILAAYNVHARTAGGCGAPVPSLTTPVREVHAMGQKVLMIVLANKVESYLGTSGTLVGDNGPAWHAGPWTVYRSDGTTQIPVQAIRRHSLPNGQPYFEVGWGVLQREASVDVDHRIYLVLGAAIGQREILHVTGPVGTDFLLPFSDYYLETPVIQVNQVGYAPMAKKRYAYVSGWLGIKAGESPDYEHASISMADFPQTAEVLIEDRDPNVPRKPVVTSVTIEKTYRANDPGAGGPVARIDLAQVPAKEGTVYRVRIPGVGVSWPTQVSNMAVFKAYYVTMRGIYYERWGAALEAPWADFTRGPAHTQVYSGELYDQSGNPISGAGVMFPPDTPKTAPRELIGGHHDAGDFDQQVHHASIPVMLMRLYESNKQGVGVDGQLTIPESGNGIPDILDEVLWELKAWEALQEDDGGIRAGCESWREPFGYYPADQDPLPYWTYSRDPGHTARFAGIFAWMSRLLRDYASVSPEAAATAQRLQDRAVRAYDYARAHGIGYETEGTLMLAAAPLFRLFQGLPGDEARALADRFKQDFEATASQTAATQGYPNQRFIVNPGFPGIGPGTFTPNWSDVVMDYLESNVDKQQWYFSSTVSQVNARADEMRRFVGVALPGEAPVPVSDAAHANPHGSGTTGWASGAQMAGPVAPIFARLQLAADGQAPISDDVKQAFLDTLSLSMDYTLGCNPAGMVWITGLGSRFPYDPLSDEALAWQREGKGLRPGVAVYGPFYDLPGAYYYDHGRNVCFPTFTQWPLHCRYADIHSWVSVNECGANVNALHAELFGMLLPAGMTPPASWLTPGPERLDPLPPREAPAGEAQAPAVTNQSPIPVSYSGISVPGVLKEVRLWVKKGAAGSWQDTGLTAAGASGTLNYTAMTGDDTYYFATRTQDNAGGYSAMPSGNGQCSTVYDVTPPNPGAIAAPARTNKAPVHITYTGASDNLSGLKEMRLWAKKEGAAWQDTGLRSTGATGGFDFAAGDGNYVFCLQAIDQAGNRLPTDPTDAVVLGGGAG